LKGPLWRRLRSLLGEGGDAIMIDLLLECGIFYHVGGTVGNYYQICGQYSVGWMHACMD
jgi:telomerase reverse transcriptase